MTARHTIRQTVARGICSGCGACGVASGGAIPITLSRHRLYEADLEGADEDTIARASRVCPFSDEAANEDQLDAPSEIGRTLPRDPRLGRYSRTFAGQHASDAYLLGSSSGGLTSWLLERLMSSGLVDGVLHVGSSGVRRPEEPLFSYQVSLDADSLTARRKSQYSATTLVQAIEHIRGDGRRYAIVGVPCFIKAARLLTREDTELAEHFALYVGLVCGHLKSEFFAESLAWQIGVPPEDLAAVDFRMKNPARASSDYDFGALRRGESEYARRRTASLVGGNWGHGAMQPEACNFCDDIFAETADVVFGDAWLPQYTKDWRGMNVVVSRNPTIDALFDEGANAGEIIIEPLSVDEAAASQSGNFRHRRDGLAVRLADDIEAGLSVPIKRICPGRDHVTESRVELIRQRRAISKLSLEAFAIARQMGDLSYYLQPMRQAIRKYQAIETPVWRRVARGCRGGLRRVMRLLRRPNRKFSPERRGIDNEDRNA